MPTKIEKLAFGFLSFYKKQKLKTSDLEKGWVNNFVHELDLTKKVFRVPYNFENLYYKIIIEEL